MHLAMLPVLGSSGSPDAEKRGEPPRAQGWASAGGRGGEALDGQVGGLGWGKERTWKNENCNPWHNPNKEKEGKWGKGPITTAGRIFHFQMDVGRKISEGNICQEGLREMTQDCTTAGNIWVRACIRLYFLKQFFKGDTLGPES